MKSFRRFIVFALAVTIPGVLPVMPSGAAASLSEIAERHCRSAGIAARQLDECSRALVTDAEQLADAADERLHQALAALREGKFAEAEKQLLAFTATDTAGDGPSRKDLALAYAALGALHAAGREASAIDFYEKARALAPGDVSDTLHLAHIYDRQNDLARAQALYQLIVDASSADDQRASFWQAGALLGLGDVARKRNQPAEAEAYYKRALELFVKLGRRDDEAAVNASLGHLALLRGQVAEARERLGPALSYYEEIGQKDAVAVICINLGAVELVAGNDAAAESYMQRALKIYQELGDKRGQLAAHFNLSTTASRLGRLDDAESHDREALKLAKELKLPQLEAIALLKIAAAQDRRGNRAEACKGYAQAADKMAAASIPEERNIARKLFMERCDNRQANRLKPDAVAPASESAEDLLQDMLVVIDGDGRVIVLTFAISTTFHSGAISDSLGKQVR